MAKLPDDTPSLAEYYGAMARLAEAYEKREKREDSEPVLVVVDRRDVLMILLWRADHEEWTTADERAWSVVNDQPVLPR